MPIWVQVLQALLTPVLASIAVYIAYQQWQANKRKLTLDRYDRRLRVYQRVVEFLTLALRDFQPDPLEIARFRLEVAEADFLFGPEIPAYIAEISEKASASWVLHLEYRDLTQAPPEGYDHRKVVEGMRTLSSYLVQQHDAARDIFHKYLDLSW